MAISQERMQALATFSAEWQTVGNHISQAVQTEAGTCTWLAKPAGATHIKVQALGQNVRYRIDDLMSAAATGFQLQAGADTMIPCPGTGISFCAEVAGATVQAQWVR